MQKLIEEDFYCYPKNQSLCIYYTDASILKNRLFKALSLQVSPKEGLLLRFRKTSFGHFLSQLVKPEKITIEIPDNSNCKIIYKNNNNLVFFDFDEISPKKVLKKSKENEFLPNKFLGFSLIENYTKEEYFKKRDAIILALEERWGELVSGNKLHGDFTHFNILLSSENKIHFIDKKEVENSILFDHFYFYSYYLQCLEKCKTINKKDVSTIKTDLQKVIFDICNSILVKDTLRSLNLEDAIGLNNRNKEKYLSSFKQIFEL
jgi:hypothetical protein